MLWSRCSAREEKKKEKVKIEDRAPNEVLEKKRKKKSEDKRKSSRQVKIKRKKEK